MEEFSTGFSSRKVIHQVTQLEDKRTELVSLGFGQKIKDVVGGGLKARKTDTQKEGMVWGG